MQAKTKHALGIIVTGAALAIAASWALATFAPPAHAADKGGLGGDCCADLEERIADLEVIAAQKGNRKITLTVEGRINEAYTYVSLGDSHQGRISNNGNDRSYVGFAGAARINKDLSAGYRLEIDLEQLGILGAPIGDTKTGVRQSYWWIKSERAGKISLGRTEQATQDFDEQSGLVDNAWIAGKAISLGGISDLYLTGIDLPFDGNYRDVVRYDSPIWEGFTVSASWGNSTKFGGGNGDTYDVAVRYFKDWGDFKVSGAAGYRHDTDFTVSLLGLTSIAIPTGDVDTFLVNGAVKNAPTGIFLNAAYANQNWKDQSFRLEGLDVTGGIEEMWWSGGKTTFAGSWGRVSFNPDWTSKTDIDYFGLGAVQAIDAAAMDLYVGWRHYDTNDLLNNDVDVISAGARIDF